MTDEEHYFRWLCETAVSFVEHYDTLLGVLHSIVFYSPVPLDDNRVKDAISLRQMFEDETQTSLDSLKEPSVLEVLIVLAQDLSFQTMDEEDIQIAFAEITSNLGIDLWCDEAWATTPFKAEHDVRLTIRQWLDRSEMTPRTPFPVYEDGKLKDTRDIELWYQMQLYNRSIDHF